MININRKKKQTKKEKADCREITEKREKEGRRGGGGEEEGTKLLG